MTDGETIALVAALADPEARAAGAAALAARVGARALLIFVEDAAVDALVPAPGLPQTLAGGPTWREFLPACRRPGLHHGSVAHPIAEAVLPAVACAGDGVALVFVGDAIDDAELAPLAALLPLVGAMLRAELAVRAKDEFLAMLSHELRNPLAPIVTALQLLRLDGHSSHEQEVIERQVGHLRRLVDALLDVAGIKR
ncbi:MAG: sensor histidine kinase [Kofleriaceae bacterium]